MRLSMRRAAAAAVMIVSVTVAGVTAHALEQGDKGEGVKVLQRLLKRNNVFSGSIDGKYGPKTTRAVEAYQKKKGLTQDGKAGKTTLGKLITYKAPLKQGSSGDGVRWLQVLLGANLPDVEEIEVDGKFGRGTKETVTDFQQSTGLTADGKVGAKTWEKLKD